jgi:hypothetical protein
MPKMSRAAVTDVDLQVRRLVKRLIQISGKDHKQIAAEMSVRTPFHVSRSMVDGWTAERTDDQGRRRSKFPVCLIPIFCEVLGSDELKSWALGDELRELLELGEATATVMNRKK